jgi:apolipoprotein D and lipocalin family protein
MNVAVLLLASLALAGDPPLAVVPGFDPNKLAGTWYEIATIPTFFTRGCTAGVSRYTPVEPGRFEVRTTCHEGSPSGPLNESDGTLRVEDPADPAKLAINYVPFIWGAYWVLELDERDGTLVVGHPSRDYLWVYARQPAMDPTRYEAILTSLEAVGYDRADIRVTAR